MKSRRLQKRIFWLVVFFFFLLNLITYLHAYRFTHFSDSSAIRTSENLSASQKLKVLFTGIQNPRPENKATPSQLYQTIRIQSNKSLTCWWIKKDTSKSTIILFHGYGGEKSSMLDKANVFLQLGYSVFLVDFMGAGSSEGNHWF